MWVWWEGGGGEGEEKRRGGGGEEERRGRGGAETSVKLKQGSLANCQHTEIATVQERGIYPNTILVSQARSIAEVGLAASAWCLQWSL